MSTAKSDERGVALLATLMAVALMTVLVIDFTYSATANNRSAINQVNELRAAYLARSGIQVGLGLLAEDERLQAPTTQGETIDSLKSFWALPFPPLPVDGGTASVSIVDETRKLNINQLVDAASGTVNAEFAQILARLLEIIGITPDLIPAIVDWIDVDSVESAGGAEAYYYMRLIPPYQPRNGPMPTIADLRMVRGVDDQTFMLLRQFLTVTPEGRVNINTAPAEVLLALVPQLGSSSSALKQLLLARPFASTSDINQISGLQSVAASVASLFTTQSSYFTITGAGTFAGTRKLVYATVRRNGVGPVMLASWNED